MEMVDEDKNFLYKYKYSRDYDEFLLFLYLQQKERSDAYHFGPGWPKAGFGGPVRRWRTSGADRNGGGDFTNKQIFAFWPEGRNASAVALITMSSSSFMALSRTSICLWQLLSL